MLPKTERQTEPKERQRDRWDKIYYHSANIFSFLLPEGTVEDQSILWIINLTASWYKRDTWQNIRAIPWVPGNVFRLNEMYMEPTLIEIPVEKMNSDWKDWGSGIQSYEEMFTKAQSNPCRFLLEAQPGFGKTLFTYKLAFDWANGALIQFDFVLAIKLKHADPKNTIPETIIDQIRILRHENVSAEMMIEILNSKDYKVLIILDGLDEITLKLHPHINNIIQENTFIQCSLLVTSRPHLINLYKEHFSHVVVNQGLPKTSLDRMLERIANESTRTPHEVYEDAGLFYLSDDVDNVKDTGDRQKKEELHYSPFLVRAAITILQHTNKSVPQQNPCKFFISLVNFILNTSEAAKRLSRDEIDNALLDAMELAYKGLLQHDSLIFEVNQLNRNEQILKLGLLSEYESSNIYGTTRRVEFIHSIIQEFLAACYIVGKFRAGQEILISEGVSNLIKNLNWELVSTLKPNKFQYFRFLNFLLGKYFEFRHLLDLSDL